VLIEQRRRIPTKVPVADIFNLIRDRSSQSEDGLVTYLELWNDLEGTPWKGNNSQKSIAKILASVIGYCADQKQPIVTTLVVPRSRRLTTKAMQNIYDAGKSAPRRSVSPMEEDSIQTVVD
jgi:hypothetical protein